MEALNGCFIVRCFFSLVPESTNLNMNFAGTEISIGERTDFGSGETNETILNGDIGMVGVPTDNCFHVIKNTGVAGSAILDGFTVKNGIQNRPYGISQMI